MNGYRLTALLILPFYIAGALFELQYLGRPLYLLLWLVGVILLIAIAWAATEAYQEEMEGRVSATEVVRELVPRTERPMGPAWPTGPETFCARCGGAVPVEEATCEHCGARLSTLAVSRSLP